MTLKANIEKAENGYIIHIYSDKGVKEKTYIAKTDSEMAQILTKEIK